MVFLELLGIFFQLLYFQGLLWNQIIIWFCVVSNKKKLTLLFSHTTVSIFTMNLDTSGSEFWFLLFHFSALSSFDSLWVLVQIIDIGFSQTLPNHDKFNCGKESFRYVLLFPCYSIFYTCGVYLTILLTIIRYITICHQNISQKVISSYKMKIYIGCIIVFSLVRNIPAWFASSSEANKREACQVNLSILS